MTERIDGLRLHELLSGGFARLHANAETVDRLNVFPVPDGDTGTNMSLTLRGGVTAAEPQHEAGRTLRAVARGALLSARGNSGVILSQFLRGLADGAQDREWLDTAGFAAALQSGTACAYQAVIRPVEGTMLTVMREGFALTAPLPQDFETLFSRLLEAMRRSLVHTPGLLPVLKDAGVIDSGGAGLVYLFEGMDAALRGELTETAATSAAPLPAAVPAGAFGRDSVLEYGYCTEFILQLMTAKTDIAAFRIEPMIDFLGSVGNSIVALQDGDLVKVHIHTFEPERVLGYARRFGEFVTIKIENMSVQHNELVQRERKRFAVVAVASGAGLTAYLRELGADAIVEGGQTQNPSAEDFLHAFAELNADFIVVLPNNSNVILTARQAAEMAQGMQVRVIPTRSVAEGYSALTMMDPTSETIDDFVASLTQCLAGVTTGYITTATRDSVLNGVGARAGQYIALADSHLLAASDTRAGAALALFAQLPQMSEKQVLTVFFGAAVGQEEADALSDAVQRRFPLLEIGVVDGGQGVYDYIFCIE